MSTATRETTPAHIWEDEAIHAAYELLATRPEARPFIQQVATRRTNTGQPLLQFMAELGEPFTDAGKMLAAYAEGAYLKHRNESSMRVLKGRRIVSE